MANVGKDMALFTAGTPNHFNSLTVAMGAIGTIWGKEAYYVFIKPERYTWEFVPDSEYFTISYFPQERNDIHKVFGFKSGRDIDKVKETGITPEILENGVTYKEATEIYVCKILYKQQMDRNLEPAEVVAMYDDPNSLLYGEPHYILIGEIVEHIVR